MPRAQAACVLAVALALRILVILVVFIRYPKGWLFSARGVEMDLLAKSILAHQGLSSPFGGATGPTAFIAPVYPIFVAAIYKLFGIDTAASAAVILLLQAAAGVLTVWLMMKICMRLFDGRIALVAGVVWAISLPLIWIPTIFWDTSFAVCLFIGLIYLALRFRERLTRGICLLLGAYIAVLTLLNPAMLFSAIAILLWVIATSAKRFRNALLIAVSFATVFSPWPIRNARVFHAFVPLRTTVGFELWMGNHDGASGFLEESVFPMYNSAELTRYETLGEIAYTNEKSALASNYIEQHPWPTAALTARRFFRYWAGSGTRGGSPFFVLHATLTTLFGLIGLFILRERRAIAILFALPLLLFPLPYYLTHAEFRYRLAIDPILTVLGAFAAVHLYRRYVTNNTEANQDQHG